MATVSMTIPDEILPRVQDAFDQMYPGRTEAGLTKAQWVKKKVVEFVKDTVKANEVRVATIAASTAASNTADTDIVIS